MRVLNYLEFADRLDRAGIGTAAAQQRAALDRTDVEVITSPWPRDADGLLSEGIVRDADVFHLNLFGPRSLALSRHARSHEISLVLHAHVTSEDFRDSFRGSNLVAPALRRYLRWFYSRADLVLCPSEHTRSLLREYPVDAPIEPVTNGVDHGSLEGHADLRFEYRDRFDLEGTVFFAVGNVFERKGLTTFCRLAEATDHDFAWFGTYDTGPHASPTVREWVADPPENLAFTGWVEEKPGMFGAGDVFLFPAWEENQGIVVLEAMACGKPCILRDIPVFREFFTDGEDCLMCSSFEEFREAVDRLAGDPDLRERLGESGRETAAKHSLDRVAERLVESYERVVTD